MSEEVLCRVSSLMSYSHRLCHLRVRYDMAMRFDAGMLAGGR